jgi:membrane associated rhomboid family serine protease
VQLPPARATVFIALLIGVAWLGLTLLGANDFAAVSGGFTPARLVPGGQTAVEAGLGVRGLAFAPAWITPLTATFVHGSLLHLGFNLLMLGFCGRFVELAIGARLLVLLYVIGAYAGAAAQFIADPHGIVPMIGASGAISAVFGAYALLFGERRGRLATHRLGKALQVAWLAAAWIGFQLLVGLSTAQAGMAVAIAAHIGGFLAGLACVRPLLRFRYRNA